MTIPLILGVGAVTLVAEIIYKTKKNNTAKWVKIVGWSLLGAMSVGLIPLLPIK
jgi:hypothetical protein